MPMKKVLIANRGEIAVRIIRACADYGVRSVAVYADPDLDALHARLADEAYGLNGQRPAETYLSIDKLLDAARRSGADAVHPGYGFLSENAAFARAVLEAGFTWIGPPPSAIEQLGDKVSARRLAMEAGAPLVAGSPGPVENAEQVLAFARQHGLPIAIKAAFGGGGRGMKVVWKMEDVAEQFDSAVREATAAFGRGECFVEQFLDRPRHVEAQVMADSLGQVVVLGTRDCSLQRRNQKLVEEAPAPFLSDEQRERIHSAARDVCRRAGYVGAGTVEFLLSSTGAISFLEVNTRLQVEHPVTEETCGLDLVVEQLRIADGLPLTLTETPAPRGHAIEFRINAEDVGRGFLPAPGPVHLFEAPSGPGVRVDSGVVSGSVVPPAFDSLMAKLIVTGATREQALARARRALAEFRIEGVPTVLPFHREVLRHPDFTAGSGFKVHTRWIETDFATALAAATRVAPVPQAPLHQLTIELDGRRVRLGLPADLLKGLAAGAAGGGVDGDGAPFASVAGDATAPAAAGDPAAIEAPMSGLLQAWKVEDGEQVQEGQLIAVLEAMKMETQVLAHRSGRVSQLAAAGATLTAGAALARIE
ncbi:acetyl-CoA/propionyl-CoA carboxylase biotin carboxyl carrier protein [Roseateles depolymerans]|uniref:Acetyl-CoA carboxylase n=2 Tax=Roseateles depolymerans TaxID=76731 RepID=A0A0U3E0I0_9BURK|nr:acetyl-CoA carboxylase [Roseateles depolymerans]REG19622.1 acetyl-CoA/propionyl-CoA carboxylase biotin carboxyl carrier protein [Roseateles depolymerans]